VISQLESAAKVLMVSISPLFSRLCLYAVSSVCGFTLRDSSWSSVSGESLDKRGAVRGAVLDSLHPAEAKRSHHHLHHHHLLLHHHNSTTLVTQSVCIMIAVSSGDVSQRPSLILQPCKSALDELNVSAGVSPSAAVVSHAVDSSACLLKHMFSKASGDQRNV